MKFYPSYAAFTFPFVITAIGLKMTMACLANMGRPLPFDYARARLFSLVHMIWSKPFMLNNRMGQVDRSDIITYIVIRA